MGAISIDKILVTPLDQITLEAGNVFHAMKDGDSGFIGFGEAYFSAIKFGAVKAWKRHLRMTLNLVVPVGMVQFVFIDEENVFREELVGSDRYVRLTIPPGIWFGFKGLANPSSILLNIADIPHDPAEIERKTLLNIPFDWSKH